MAPTSLIASLMASLTKVSLLSHAISCTHTHSPALSLCFTLFHDGSTNISNLPPHTHTSTNAHISTETSTQQKTPTVALFCRRSTNGATAARQLLMKMPHKTSLLNNHSRGSRSHCCRASLVSSASAYRERQREILPSTFFYLLLLLLVCQALNCVDPPTHTPFSLVLCPCQLK